MNHKRARGPRLGSCTTTATLARATWETTITRIHTDKDAITMAQRPIMTFAELKAQQDAQAHTMPAQDAAQAPAPAPAGAVSFAQIAAQQSMPVHTVNTAQTENTAQAENTVQPAAQPDDTAQHINNSIYAVNPYLDPSVEMPEPEPFDVTNLKYADDAPADPLANATHISGRRDDVYDRVYL